VRSFNRGPQAYGRERGGQPSTGKTFLIVTEGEKTEPNYFDVLKRRLQLSNANVVVMHPPATDPVSLTSAAIKLRDERARQVKKNPWSVEYDEVWVVYDLERTHDERRRLAKQAAPQQKNQEILAAESDPCFEYWFLLHEEYTTKPFPDAESVIKHLKRKHPAWSNYAKSMPILPSLMAKVPSAVARAEQCRRHHQRAGGDRNPSTDVDILVRSLNAATRSHLQFKLPSAKTSKPADSASAGPGFGRGPRRR
jgi:hypothetical protein